MVDTVNTSELERALDDLKAKIRGTKAEWRLDYPDDDDIDSKWAEMDRRHKATRARLADSHGWTADVVEGLKMDFETLALTFERWARKLGRRPTAHIDPSAERSSGESRKLMSSD
jgi:hypothetical protein